MMNVRELSFHAPLAAATTVSVSTSSAQSPALETGDYLYVCDQDSNILFGTNPTATTSCVFVPAKVLVRIQGVSGGHKCAVIAAGSGTAWLSKGL